MPFCRTICYYCDFCHRIYDEKLAEQWLDKLEKEIKENCHDAYETIYIGGGTPTSLHERQLDRLLCMIDPYAGKTKEYTIEVNPESLDQKKIELLKRHGINRVSMGLQSADDTLLQTIGRKHTFCDAKEKISMLKDSGITNISVDLMYSLPSQTIRILEDTLNKVLELDVPHISLYSLTIEENSVFGKKGITALDEETEADMYERIEKTLTGRGYVHYEVSNYCRKGYESRHNLGYWNYDDFLGVSLGASGKIGNNRYTNTRSFQKYFYEENIRDEDLYLEKKEMMFENIMMSLRTIYGLDVEQFKQRYHCDLPEEYPKGINNPNIRIERGRMICTKLSILNRVLLDFMDGRDL